jgi:aspartyl protease
VTRPKSRARASKPSSAMPPRFRWSGIGVVLVIACVSLILPARAAAPDAYAPRDGMEADTVLYLDAWSGAPSALERVRARLARAPEPVNVYDDWALLCHFDYHHGKYRDAIRDCGQAIAFNPQGDDASTLSIAKLLVHAPAPRVSGAGEVPVTAGVRVPVEAGDYHGVALADTGAQISVMMQSVARSARVRIFGTSGKIGSTTGSIVGEIGILPAVRMGRGWLRDLPVLVLPDSQLTIGDGTTTVSLPFILSGYALAQFGRVAWLDHDKRLAFGKAAPASFAGAVRMMWHPNGIAVPLAGTDGRRAAHFDTGANVSYLYESGTALLSETERASIHQVKRKIGGVAGVVEQDVRQLPRGDFTLAGAPLVLEQLDIAPTPDTGEAARLGEDVLKSYRDVVFDFEAMTFSVAQ